MSNPMEQAMAGVSANVLHYHHFNAQQPQPPEVKVNVSKNTKGFNYEVEVSHCTSVEQAMKMLEHAMVALRANYDA